MSIEDIEKNIKIQELFELYGNLLTDKQREIMYLYYFSDLSLREIAQNKKISYQGVRDFIKKSEKSLLDFEDKIRLLDKKMKIEEAINILKNEEDKEKVIKILESI